MHRSAFSRLSRKLSAALDEMVDVAMPDNCVDAFTALCVPDAAVKYPAMRSGGVDFLATVGLVDPMSRMPPDTAKLLGDARLQFGKKA